MKPYSILIVEDHPFQHMYLQHLFSELGEFNLEAAGDGKEALERLQQRDFDLVLTDLLMPGMDGVQFIQSLADLRHKPALAIMSAASRRMLMAASLVAKNLDVEVIGLISKPVAFAALRNLTEQLDGKNRSTTKVIPAPLEFDRHSIIRAMSDGQFQT
jgi:CheY-like chemotaxis protein